MVKRLIERLGLDPKVPRGTKRSGKWSAVRKAFLIRNPECALCGGKKSLEVHHVQPFHLNPELELNESNLITLCEKNRCHLTFGHCNDFRGFNPDVIIDSKGWSIKIRDNKERINAKKSN